MFCDDGATCMQRPRDLRPQLRRQHLPRQRLRRSGPTIARFDHLTNVGALDVGCKAPGPGVRIDKAGGAPDNYSFINAIFWGNAPGLDFAANCDSGCGKVRRSTSRIRWCRPNTSNQRPERSRSAHGIMAPVDPLFADPANGDFHLKSTAGRWTPTGYVSDAVIEPRDRQGRSEGRPTENPERAGKRNELGAYGNSGEASYVR